MSTYRRLFTSEKSINPPKREWRLGYFVMTWKGKNPRNWQWCHGLAWNHLSAMSGHLTPLSELQHFSCTKGQIQGENDYAIVKLSTTTRLLLVASCYLLLATCYPLFSDQSKWPTSSNPISKKLHYVSVFLLSYQTDRLREYSYQA